MGCTIPDPEGQARDNVEAGAQGKAPVPIPVKPGTHEDLEVDPFVVAVKATREGEVVHVRYTGALPSDGSYDFRISGHVANTLRVTIVDHNTSDQRVSAVRPTSLSIDVPNVPESVTKVAVSGPSSGFGTITAAIQ